MPSFSAKSLSRLETCELRLHAIFTEVVRTYDCTILEGHRGKAAQDRAFDEGRSKVRFPDGKHNLLPSEAVDAAPSPIPEDWGDHPDPKVVARFYHFAGYVKGVATAQGHPLRWGGDWDGDFDFRDQTFDDLVHFELLEG